MDNKRFEMLLDSIIINDMILTKSREEFNSAVKELYKDYDSINLDELDEKLTSKVNVAKQVLIRVLEENESYNNEILGANSDRGRTD